MGLGSSWGSREEFLHPRDRRGRFRKKWKMAAGVIDAISGFLDKFTPRTFQSDGQAAQFLFNRAKPSRFGGGTQYARLHADYDEANQHLRAGDIDAPTQKFVKMMDDSAINLDSDVILSRTMGPEAFGLTPEQLGLEDGGVEDFTGRLIADRGYTAANIGTPLSHGPGKITMTIAVPKGTKAMIPARSQNDRGIFLDRDQELRITKVKSDGRGGWYMMAVATPRTPGETPEPLDRGPRGVGLSPQQRETRVRDLQGMQAKREGIRSDAEINAEEIERGIQQVKAEQPQQTTQAPAQPAVPGEPPPRNEPVLKEAVGGADTEGKGTAEIAQTPPPEPPAAPEAPAPERNFRDVVREAGLPVPSPGKRRTQWNRAYGGLTSGRKDPGDVLRELDSDIQFFKARQADNERNDITDASLGEDIDALDKLAGVIAQEYGLERQPKPAPAAPVKKAAPQREMSNLERGSADLEKRIATGKVAVKRATPGAVTPISQAAGEKRRELPGEAGGRGVTSIKAFKATKAQGIQEREERKRRLLEPSPEAPAPAKKAPAKKASVTSLEEARTARAGRVTLAEAKRRTAVDAINENKIEGEGDNSYKNILRNVESGEWTPAKARQEARSSQKYWRNQADMAKGFGRATPEEQQRIQDKNNAIADQYEKLETALLESESVTKTDKYRNPEMGKKAAPSAPEAAPESTNEDLVKRLFNDKKPTMAQLRQFAEDRRVGEGQDIKKMSRRELVETIIGEASPRRGLGSIPAAPVAKKTAPTTPEVPEENRIPVRGGGFVDTRTGELHGGPSKAAPAPAPVEAFPETAPGSGKVRMSQLRAGVPILIEQGPDGKWRPATKKTGATKITVQEINPVTGRGGQRQVIGVDDQGNRVEVQSRANVQTFFLGNAPAKKVAPKAAVPAKKPVPAKASPASTPDILAKLNETDANDVPTLTREQAAELVAPLRKAQLVELAKEYSVPSPSSKTVPELKRWIVEAGVGRRLDSIAIRGFTGKRPTAPGVGLTPAEREAGQIAGVPKTPEAGAAPDLDKMTVPELKKLAKDELVPLGGLTRKQQIKEAILRNRESGAGGVSTKGAEAVLGPGVLERIQRDNPVEPNAPAAQKPIQAPDRREAFADDWLNTPSLANINEKTAAGRTINEVRDDVLKGKITPDEGIRRLENDIELNKADLAEAQRELRGDLPTDERELVSADVDKLRKAISDQENASSFIRKHFRKAPVVTPKEVEVQLNPEAAKLVQGASADDIREAAKVGGFGELKGSNKDELLQDLVKKIAGKELASRAAKKVAPKKLAPAPLVTKKSSDPDYVDARAIAEGLDMDEADLRLLKQFQDDLDGKNGRKTPATVGREVENWAKGPGGPFWERVVHGQITLEKAQDRVAGREPSLAGPEVDREDLAKAEAKDAALKARGDRWLALAERLKKTRRRPARKATEPAPEKPKLTPEEKKVTAQAADVLGVPKEQLQRRALAKKVAAAPAPEAAKSAVDTMRTMQSREEGQAFLKNRTKAELQEIAKAGNISYGSKDTKAKIVDQIVQWTIGRRLDTEAISKPTPRRPDPDDPMGLRILARGGFRDKGNLENMSPAELADVETELGIKRASLDRAERIAAIRARQADQARGAQATRSLPASGRQWDWERLAEDGGVMHGDSASMNLAQKLRKAGREEDARYVADMRFRISSPTGEHLPDDVEKMVRDLRDMLNAEQDPSLKAAYERAISDMGAPESPAPDLPESTPPVLRKMMDELNQIPVARKSGHFAGTTKSVSAVDRLAELLRKVDAGDGGSVGQVQDEIRRILHSFHESVDGAYQMWRLSNLTDDPQIRNWVRSFYPKT